MDCPDNLGYLEYLAGRECHPPGVFLYGVTAALKNWHFGDSQPHLLIK